MEHAGRKSIAWRSVSRHVAQVASEHASTVTSNVFEDVTATQDPAQSNCIYCRHTKLYKAYSSWCWGNTVARSDVWYYFETKKTWVCYQSWSLFLFLLSDSFTSFPWQQHSLAWVRAGQRCVLANVLPVVITLRLSTFLFTLQSEFCKTYLFENRLSTTCPQWHIRASNHSSISSNYLDLLPDKSGANTRPSFIMMSRRKLALGALYLHKPYYKMTA